MVKTYAKSNARIDKHVADLLKQMLRKMLGDVPERGTPDEDGDVPPTQNDLAAIENETKPDTANNAADGADAAAWDCVIDLDLSLDDGTAEPVARMDSAAEALLSSLQKFGVVDMPYMTEATGLTVGEIAAELGGAIYQDPAIWGGDDTYGWKTADDYLSGNILRKLTAAREAAKKNPARFKGNVKALEQALPPQLPQETIYVTLGSPWLPAKIIDDFMFEVFGDAYKHCTADVKRLCYTRYKTRHNEMTGTWHIADKNRYLHSPTVNREFGTKRTEALALLEKTLNMSPVTVYDTVYCATTKSHKRQVVNADETLAAAEAQKKMIQAFADWVWKDDTRAAELQSIFEAKYGCTCARRFDGSFLPFEGLAGGVSLYPYQKNAAARIIMTPNTLLAHDVGAGKTYVMIAAGQELLRMHRSRKNMYVVPNNLVGQWKALFAAMYPQENVFCITPTNYGPAKREATLRRAAEPDVRNIIMAYSCFDALELSAESRRNAIKEEIDKADDSHFKAVQRTGLDARRKLLGKKLTDIAAEKPAKYPCFDELGIDRLFVDEAHNYKNVPVDTNMNNVLGVHGVGSKKCQGMLEKVQYLQRTHGGGGIVMATGTPITNSITDAFIFQKYLQSGELALLDLGTFDAWIGMFAEKTTQFEVDVDTNSYRMATRFSKFHNLPQLTAMLASFADFHKADEADGLPTFDGYTDVKLPKSPALTEFLKNISKRAEDVRHARVSPKDDNLLKITTDGRKAALDVRLVDLPDAGQCCKVKECAARVLELYFATTADKSAQIVFCDTSTPKAGFNVYDALRDELVAGGIPTGEIAFVHDAASEKAREKLFSAVRRGDVRVVIGSTFKLGLGVNIQDRLIALHHIDVPWRPADMVQREGRIFRQGNRNEKVHVYRYVTLGSFDAYSWQLLETKQRFISDLLSGSVRLRDGDDIDSVVLNYAEIKALAIGNPKIKQRVERANELSHLETLQRQKRDGAVLMRDELARLPGSIAQKQNELLALRGDLKKYRAWKKTQDAAGKAGDAALTEERRLLREKIEGTLCNPAANNELVADYCGFRIYASYYDAALSDSPEVWIHGEGTKYHVSLGQTPGGYVARIDNTLASLKDKVGTAKTAIARLDERRAELNDLLTRDDEYQARIDELRAEIEKLDKDLGVKTK